MRVNVIPFVVGAWNGLQRFRKKIGGTGNQRKNQDYFNDSIIEIGCNTEKSSGELRRLSVIQTPVKDHQL